MAGQLAEPPGISVLLMSNREAAWRAKPPDGWDERVASLQGARMYLVQECGPTTFMIKEASVEEGQEDPRQNGEENELRSRRRAGDRKFKVQIGGLLGCSCKAKHDGPCKHLLFVLLKLLRVSPENPLAWQAALLDNEVEQILRGRYNPVQNIRRPAAERTNGDRPNVDQKPIEEGDVCAICQVLLHCSLLSCKDVFCLSRIWQCMLNISTMLLLCLICRSDSATRHTAPFAVGG